MLFKASAICFAVFLLLFAGVEMNVFAWMDNRAFSVFEAFTGLKEFSFLGSEIVLGTISIILVVLLTWKRHIYGVMAVLTSVAGGNVLNKWLKEAVGRERPPFNHGEDGLSFVSGHAMLGLIVYLLICYFLLSFSNRDITQRIGYAAAIVLAGLAGFSRVAERAHYLSDVLAGFSLGAAIFFLTVAVLEKWSPAHQLARIRA
ncbi:undecaprenyl-diphosphatase [Bacillus ectoiniformans]|uniref:phosphatase PAP2 family protein n=1 Tax=Bacillus ectoiniformans TaxID=1494429 RepID=UPI0019576E26|nr:phosphatase PAP2 family protein [Bacillus ectoiniformans]MBM7647606.1 undecaprenyl-diphosphatase [Bacillus ectoiniformans]